MRRPASETAAEERFFASFRGRLEALKRDWAFGDIGPARPAATTGIRRANAADARGRCGLPRQRLPGRRA